MKKISLLFVVAVLACAGCQSAQTSTTNSNSPVNQQNSNIPAVNSPANILSNKNQTSQANRTADPELLKQIEAQQLETADPRKAANKNTSANNKPSNSAQRQPW